MSHYFDAQRWENISAQFVRRYAYVCYSVETSSVGSRRLCYYISQWHRSIASMARSNRKRKTNLIGFTFAPCRNLLTGFTVYAYTLKPVSDISGQNKNVYRAATSLIQSYRGELNYTTYVQPAVIRKRINYFCIAYLLWKSRIEPLLGRTDQG
jgi:hypothetical protein